MEDNKQNPNKEKQANFPLMELATGGISGIGALGFQIGSFIENKLNQANEKFGLDMQNWEDYQRELALSKNGLMLVKFL
jgi:hypothetical protein